MFTQTMTNHVVSRVNEEGDGGVRLGTLPVSFSQFVYHSHVTCHAGY